MTIATASRLTSGAQTTHRSVRRWTRHAPFLIVFVLACLVLSIHLNSPWQSLHEDNGLVFESIAINHIRLGLIYTHGQDFFDPSVHPVRATAEGYVPAGATSANEFQFLLTSPSLPLLYGHHPPLLGLTVAGSLLLFSYHFWAIRLVPVVFTLVALALFYLLMALLFEPRVAAFASALFISFPVTAYYGRNVAHEAPTLAFELGMALCYALWRKSGRARWLLIMSACAALGVAYGWPMLFFAWILLGLDALMRRRLHMKLAIATAGAATVLFTLVIVQIAWAAGWSLRTLQTAFAMRSLGYAEVSPSTSALAWVQVILRHNLLDFGLWTWLILPFALLFLWRHFRGEGRPLQVVWRHVWRGEYSLRAQLIMFFALGGIAHILIFWDGAYVHDYWQFYLIPFYAAALGWGGMVYARRLESRSRWLMKSARQVKPESMAALTLIALAGFAFILNAPLIWFLYSTKTVY